MIVYVYGKSVDLQVQLPAELSAQTSSKPPWTHIHARIFLRANSGVIKFGYSSSNCMADNSLTSIFGHHLPSATDTPIFVGLPPVSSRLSTVNSSCGVSMDTHEFVELLVLPKPSFFLGVTVGGGWRVCPIIKHPETAFSVKCSRHYLLLMTGVLCMANGRCMIFQTQTPDKQMP